MTNIYTTLLTQFFLIITVFASAQQEVEIINAAVNPIGQVQLQIEGSADNYYLLSAKHPTTDYELVTSMTLGEEGLMVISEPLAALPYDSYTVTAYPISNPGDIDNDGLDDIAEYNNMPSDAPLNFAQEIPFIDGTTSVPNADVFTELAVVDPNIPWAPFLNNQEFAKFVIVNQDSDNPRVYFINSKTHYIHADFIATIDTGFDPVTTGEIVYNPNAVMPNGVIGTYSFNYSFGDAYSFGTTQRTFELLAANMPFLRNNLVHFIGQASENTYLNNYAEDYLGSRITVTLESDVLQDVDYIPFNQAEGYGFFRVMELDENPGSRDVVLYDALPNNLPRVGGIMTSVVQTPLSHVNLRAIQDNLPNAYIKNPLEIDSIANLLGKYVYYRVDQDKYTIREATLEEVNAWFENIRPTEEQIPIRDLSRTEILPLDEIGFEMSSSFGAKCSNVATMRTFGFEEGTIPNGFGVPFYFYDEFMKFNGFYEDVEDMITDPEFINDLETRIDMLDDFRKEIRDAPMPQWMLDELQAMHESFPEGTSVRCRSSTNNEDLPGFSGAGLYTSKTQHPEEGHIQKSIKQVYASMWNFRAFDERDFYRVDHFIAAMGVLCHPNYQEEKSNGVGVSIDPIYQTENTFYLNTQVGEFLITNPDANSIPEEILLSEDPLEGFSVLRYSNLVPNGTLVMNEGYLDEMRSMLRVIHDEFAVLYNVVGAEGFGMDIEYKVTAQDQLIVKQARPWVSFWADINANNDLAIEAITEPVSSSGLGNAELVTATVANVGLREMQNFDISLLLEDELIETLTISDVMDPQSSEDYQFTVPQDFSETGNYNVSVIVNHPMDGYSRNDTLHTIIRNLYNLEAEFDVELASVRCGQKIEARAHVTNYGESTINTVRIDVNANGQLVETVTRSMDLDFEESESFIIEITENLQDVDNVLTLDLVAVNGTEDAIDSNNSGTFSADLDPDNRIVTLLFKTDDYPEESTWEVIDNSNGLLVANGGGYTLDETVYDEDICVKNDKCYTLIVYDSYGDGICCGFGDGNFSVVDNQGEVILENSGQFGSFVEEVFCIQDTMIVNNTTELALSSIHVAPNPTEDFVTISINDSFDNLSDVSVDIFNSLGRKVAGSTIFTSSNQFSTQLSLSNMAAGTYIAKCYNADAETYVKIVKL